MYTRRQQGTQAVRLVIARPFPPIHRFSMGRDAPCSRQPSQHRTPSFPSIQPSVHASVHASVLSSPRSPIITRREWTSRTRLSRERQRRSRSTFSAVPGKSSPGLFRRARVRGAESSVDVEWKGTRCRGGGGGKECASGVAGGWGRSKTGYKLNGLR